MKNFILIAALLLGTQAIAQKVKLDERFKYTGGSDPNYSRNWEKFSMDGSDSTGNRSTWGMVGYELPHITWDKYNGVSLLENLSDSSGILFCDASSGSNSITNIQDDWIVYKTPLNITHRDTLIYWVGGNVYPSNSPGDYTPDTVQIWFAPAGSGNHPSGFTIMLDQFVVTDTVPLWYKSTVSMAQFTNDSLWGYVGIRRYLQEAAVTFGRWMWFDAIYIGENPAQNFNTAVEGLHASTYFQLQPNPARQSVTISFAQGAQSVVLYNSIGQKLQTLQLAKSNTSQQINLQGLSPGIYLVALQNGQGTFIQRLLVE